MTDSNKPAPGAPDDWDPLNPPNDDDRRRFGRVVHDERGQARVEWVKPPEDWQRVELSIEDHPPAAVVRRSGGYNPYESSSAGSRKVNPPALPAKPARTDLRKLSEHIKQMRALKQRQERGES